ncbi:MAG: hypothetical protein COT84_05520 [Chlamydiae bacterium CG10_big_fil_rev_8_21_14_0_10_35_9]|nr:MAG: hypothetical protein COT84_05520 [Chlamydiae bacterium CG10_big_fil_rev_8_21_14_0_10_35_9]
MNEEKSFDWIGLIIIIFFLIFPLINTFFTKKKEQPPLPRKEPKRKVSPPPMVRKLPPISVPIKKIVPLTSKVQKKRQKKVLSKYGSLQSGIILSEILKRPYID